MNLAFAPMLHGGTVGPHDWIPFVIMLVISIIVGLGWFLSDKLRSEDKDQDAL